MLHNNRKALARPAKCYACESATVCVCVFECVLGLVLTIASYGCHLQAQTDRETNTIQRGGERE